MTRGRKATPPGVNKVRGNPGKRAPRQPTLAAPAGAPTPPDFLNERARAEWGRIVPELLALGVLSTVDRAALALYCLAYARLEEAEEQIRESPGLVVMTTNGNAVQNPYLSVANKAMEQMHRYLSEFGLTPASRMRVPKAGTGEDADPAAAYFTGPRAVA